MTYHILIGENYVICRVFCFLVHSLGGPFPDLSTVLHHISNSFSGKRIVNNVVVDFIVWDKNMLSHEAPFWGTVFWGLKEHFSALTVYLKIEKERKKNSSNGDLGRWIC
jgi:hypothetical protein